VNAIGHPGHFGITGRSQSPAGQPTLRNARHRIA
jgi:hypothetical protein